MIPTLEALKDWDKTEYLGYRKLLQNGIEICLEPLIFDQQWYLAIYDRDKNLIGSKIVVKLGKETSWKT